ncbi:hypothetical protein CYK37_05055 [Mesorhizobium loti]|nr:DUF1624 domain-containing protein [Mesorhizobium loti]PLP60506.1 hypothetical protein CYK37_05055 [Mesorhizobium loti]
MSLEQQTNSPRRITLIDALRGIALLAMASYHFTWDLEFFGYASAGLTAHGPWKLYARCIASSFLFLVGVSLVLAHGERIRWPGFWKRFAMVAVAAAAISLITFFATRPSFIFFGILHQIALASALGLLFLRLPALLTLVVAALVIAAPFYLRSPIFDHPALLWVGLSSADPRSNDYVPLFPWFGAVLIGIGMAKLAKTAGLFERLARVSLGQPFERPLTFIGRHSLAFYLIHQPVLIGCVWLFAQVWSAPAPDPKLGFTNACQASCQDRRDAAFCVRYCGCMLTAVEKDGLLAGIMKGDQPASARTRISDLASTCTVQTEDVMSPGDPQ